MAVAAFIVFWVLLGIGIFLVASRGGAKGARERAGSPSPGAQRAFGAVMAVVYVGIGAAIPFLVMRGDADRAEATPGIDLTAKQKKGQDLFPDNCGRCHALKASRTTGRVGPDLDQLRPKAVLTLDAIKNGRVRGNGTMPAGILLGEEAEAVAQYIEKVAGKQ